MSSSKRLPIHIANSQFIENTTICFIGEEYVVLDDSQDHWWEVRNSRGEVGFIPSNYVKELDALGLQNFDW